MTRTLYRTATVALLVAFAAVVPSAIAQGTHAPDWRVGATCYEVFVRSFRDSDGDGIGDLNGLTSALDHINDGKPNSTRSLGARCLWLMPVMETPGYHGYDISDYYRVSHVLGTNDDFKRFVAEAHKRGIKVLLDMVLNHASSDYARFSRRCAIRRRRIAVGSGSPPHRAPTIALAATTGTSRRCATSTTTGSSGVGCRISTMRPRARWPR